MMVHVSLFIALPPYFAHFSQPEIKGIRLVV